MTSKGEDKDNLEEIADSLKYLLVLQLFSFGVVQGEIAKKLHLSKSTVNDMLKGTRRGDVPIEPNKARF